MAWYDVLALRNSRDLVDAYNKAFSWIERHSACESGIAVSSINPRPYPEVAGYFIPTLISWGERDMASSFARWIVTRQNDDGSWSDPDGQSPYTFDTGQILKGLLAIIDVLPELEMPVRRGCDWLLTQIQESGRVVTPDTSHWGLPGQRVVPEAIHLYALEPLRKSGELFGNRIYSEAVERGIEFYVADPELTDFNTLSHFHAYIIEALIDLGRTELAVNGMKKLERYQKRNGVVPAYKNVRWICSTGLFQYALIWYKLGDIQRGNAAFSSALRLQNSSGGFYGSYGFGANYFPNAEISWAIKYFLDALNHKIISGFNVDAAIFPDSISESDGRYILVAEEVKKIGPTKVLEVGCGKGRFLRRLANDFPNVTLSGLDVSEKMLSSLPLSVTPLKGSLLDIPCPTNFYDFVFCVEALEHAVNIAGAIRELCRIVAPNGMLVIIDKSRALQGRLRISEWEQWFDLSHITNLIAEQGFNVEERSNIPYDLNDGNDGLFIGWIAKKPIM